MKEQKLETAKKLLSFATKKCESAYHSPLAKLWNEQFCGSAMAKKLKMYGPSLILGAVMSFSGYQSGKAFFNLKKAESLPRKPLLIDVPESLSDDGKVLDWDKIPEADQNVSLPPKENEEKPSKKVEKRLSEVKQKVASSKKAEKKPVQKSETVEENTPSVIETVLQKVKGRFSDAESNQKLSVKEHNQKMIKQAMPEVASFLIYFEDFSDEPYLDDAKVPTIGYGTTVYPDGTRVKMSDKPISRTLGAEIISEHVTKNDKDYKQAMFAKGRYYMEEHLNKRVMPAIAQNVKVKLNKGQVVAIASWIYNLGEDAFKRSTFLKKLNAGDENAFAEMTRYNVCAGKWNRGLQVRRGIEYLLAEGHLNPSEIVHFRASGGYDKDNLNLLFGKRKDWKNRKGKQSIPNVDQKDIASFVRSQKAGGIKVSEIMDRKTVYKIASNNQLLQKKGKERV